MKQFFIRVLNKGIHLLTQQRNKLTAPQPGSHEYIMGKRVEPWFRDDGDNTLRIKYNLNESSIVFDVGGYKGEFASVMVSKYDCTVYVFEPIPEFYQVIVNKFSGNKKIRPYCFGLSDKTGSQKISLTDNRSSLYIEDNNAITIQLKSAVDFIRENNITTIDLVKINIEGSEYALLESLIAAGMITKFKNIQVQFHDFIIENARGRMEKIQQELAKTHELTYQYDFIWENWKLKA